MLKDLKFGAMKSNDDRDITTIDKLTRLQDRTLAILKYVQKNIRYNGNVHLRGYYTKEKINRQKG